MISRPSIKLAGVDSDEASFRFKTMAAFDEGMMLLARGRSVTELTLTLTLTLTYTQTLPW